MSEKTPIHTLIVESLLIFANTQGNLKFHQHQIGDNLRFLRGKLSQNEAEEIVQKLESSALRKRLGEYNLRFLVGEYDKTIEDLKVRDFQPSVADFSSKREIHGSPLWQDGQGLWD